MLGKTILQYQIIQKLGAGGMGEIYKALDTRLNRPVAIKVLSGEGAGDPARRRRFIQEAQAASSLNHPNIIVIHDIVSHNSQEFMVMEFVSGKPLTEIIAPSGMPIAEILKYSVQMADALEAAHGAGIIHRDIKPGNIMVTENGQIKILDFGLAKLAEDSAAVSLTDDTKTIDRDALTLEGSILGTVNYMSPEQAESKRLDRRSDIFSFGVVLYEMATGRKAFAANSIISTLSAIMRDEPRPIAEIAGGVPSELDELIQRALRKNPDDRWQSMAEIHARLLELKQRSDSGVLNLAPPVAARKKKGSLLALGFVSAAIVFTGAAFWWMQHSPARLARTPSSQISAPAAREIKPSPLADAALTNDGVLQMMQAKVSTTVIIEQIQASKTQFDLSTAEIIRLAKAGVPDNVIQAMRKAGGAANAAPAAVAAQTQTVRIASGAPIAVALSEDVPVNPPQGLALRFQVSQDVQMGGAVVVAKGAAVTGEIVEKSKKKFLSRSGKPTFRLTEVTAVDGSKLLVRATPGRSGGKGERPFEPHGHASPKNLAAAAGDEFIAYVDGDQTVKVRR